MGLGYNSKYTGEQVEGLLDKIDNATIPTKTSELTNDSNFITETAANNKFLDKSEADSKFLDESEVADTYSTKEEVERLSKDLNDRINGITVGELIWNEVE